MLDAINLTCIRDERTLFSNLSFSVSAGEMVQVAGQNGAGKTSLLRLLAGLSQAEEGEVHWQGKTLPRNRDVYHQDLLWLGHQPGIKTVLTAFENLSFFHGGGDEARLWQALTEAGLVGFEDVPVNQLSAGQQRRVALARLWLSHARLWILDEPFTAIDAAGVEKITRQMVRHTNEGGMVILTTHQPLALSFVRQIVLQEAQS
ncbi:cytochrome c biogenesis heme-transporting ATPase CcmA [Enterobacteriaceae bacterium H20N1]|uniref:Cytochrome c biogenesis heme-transporting ATPase CcmA n=1 Tax=Dryocola boscaweniae TaxID=2925397 RepID=A0A9X2W887_9ENTR|nr:cytochrome c biogenesis heme-transporting ATPase CcmA [Dryocola boscaweniae]MCT4702346.1 cytochrome c biogenesis heme-transporting ATPase CcmA [Dryocola boscaweniae]MCT4716614.1 cytochrome c biogenesis heme-transporting ATPase CcmA [Dryocola boscaweniae]MCT4719514.1 cytochrome c biogenesis heme-transporting ATPase CcmA [Dryocola boscaweniae]